MNNLRSFFFLLILSCHTKSAQKLEADELLRFTIDKTARYYPLFLSFFFFS